MNDDIGDYVNEHSDEILIRPSEFAQTEMYGHIA